ncbi:ankyrin repeat-containing domain protein [Poronia punctata]|nr:ankyrin repeat-containing domain protein [Poronia punctata]
MLCLSCGSPISPHQDSISLAAQAEAAAADRRRDQNRRAQQRFRLKKRQRKAASTEDQPHPQNKATYTTQEDHSPIGHSELTPPSTISTSPGHSLAVYGEERQGENTIDWGSLLDVNDGGGVDTGFWAASLDDTTPLPTTPIILPSEEVDQNTRGKPSDSLEGKRPPAGLMVLHRAVRTGNSKVVRLLLEHNADCNSKDSEGLTPLLCAVVGGHEEVLDLLLSHGADIRQLDNSHRSALHWAVLNYHHSILKRLLCCCDGDASLINWLNKDGETPLSVAVGAGSEVAVKLLLEFGATINIE